MTFDTSNPQSLLRLLRRAVDAANVTVNWPGPLTPTTGKKIRKLVSSIRADLSALAKECEQVAKTAVKDTGKTKAAAVAKSTLLQWIGDEKIAKALTSDGWVYHLCRFGTLGSGDDLGGGGYTVYCMPVTAEKMRNYKIGVVPTLEQAKAVAEKHQEAVVLAKWGAASGGAWGGKKTGRGAARRQEKERRKLRGRRRSGEGGTGAAPTRRPR
jgi:hypothetical protein